MIATKNNVNNLFIFLIINSIQTMPSYISISRKIAKNSTWGHRKSFHFSHHKTMHEHTILIVRAVEIVPITSYTYSIMQKQLVMILEKTVMFSRTQKLIFVSFPSYSTLCAMSVPAIFTLKVRFSGIPANEPLRSPMVSVRAASFQTNCISDDWPFR